MAPKVFDEDEDDGRRMLEEVSAEENDTASGGGDAVQISALDKYTEEVGSECKTLATSENNDNPDLADAGNK